MKKLIVLIGLLVAFSASARDCEKEDLGTAAQLRDCLTEQSYQPVQSSYDGLVKKLSNKEAIDLLNNAQSSWIQFRDATCIYAKGTYNGSDMPNDVETNCTVEFNAARVKTLTRYAKEAKASN